VYFEPSEDNPFIFSGIIVYSGPEDELWFEPPKHPVALLLITDTEEMDRCSDVDR